MRILVVAPNYRNNAYYEFPLGLAYVAGSLKANNFSVECLNLNHYYEPIDVLLEEKIIGHDIDILCTGGLSAFYNLVDNILQSARRIKPGIITIVGGGLVSSEPEAVIKGLGADYGVIGEGEETIVELAHALQHGLSISKIKGVAYFDVLENFVQGSERGSINELDSIPYPDYEGFEMQKYLDMQLPNDGSYLYSYDDPRCFPIISSRSCPFSCTFCYHPIGKKYRSRSFDNIFHEIEILVDKYNVKTLVLYDELFSDQGERVVEFCKRIKPYNLKWFAQLRVANIDAEIIELMKDSGCYQMSYGLESAHPAVLKSMKKHTTVSEIEKALELTYNADIGIQGNFIFFDPAETTETAQTTLSWWLDNLHYQVNLLNIEIYPGTALWDIAVEKKLITDKIAFLKQGSPQPINISSMSDEQFNTLRTVIGMMIEKYVRQMPCPEVLDICKHGVESNKRVTYDLKLRCPHCKKVTQYRRLQERGALWYGIVPVIGCRQCNQRMLLPISRHFEYLHKRVNHILEKCSPGRIGILLDTSGLESIVYIRTLFALTDLSHENACFIFSDDPFDQGHKLNEIDVLNIRTSLSQAKDIVDSLIITSELNYQNLRSDLFSLEEHGVKLFSLYDRELRPFKDKHFKSIKANQMKFENLNFVKRVVIFGTGQAGINTLQFAQQYGWDVVCFVDNNKEKWGSVFSGHAINNPCILSDLDFDLIIVASATGKEAIYSQLGDAGFMHGKDYLFFLDPVISNFIKEIEIKAIKQSPYAALLGLGVH